MKKKRVILKTSTAIATAVTLGAISTASLSSCNKFIIEPSSSNFSISPDSYSGDGNTVNWTATRNVDGQIEEKTGSEVLTQDITSFDVIFDSGATHTYEVKWIYTIPHAFYNITPNSSTNDNNVISWTATKHPIGGGEDVVKTGECKLNASNNPRTSYTVNFGTDSNPEYYTFTNLYWQYKSVDATYSISPIKYCSVNNEVNWTANWYKNGYLVDVQTGKYELKSSNDNKTSFNVTFEDDNHHIENHVFEVSWTYKDVTTYSIDPPSYQGYGTFSWSANKLVNGVTVATANGNYTLDNDQKSITKYEVTFSDETTYQIPVAWTYQTSLEYVINPMVNLTNTINWTATKTVDGTVVDTETGKKVLASDRDNTTTFDVKFDSDEETHSFSVNWQYVEPTYLIDPDEYEDTANYVEWTATRYENEIKVEQTEGTKDLTETLTEYTVTFDSGYEHTFEDINWIYTEPVIECFLKATSNLDNSIELYYEYDNTVNYTAERYVNGSKVETKTGTYTLHSEADNIGTGETENLRGDFTVTFDSGYKKTFKVWWRYRETIKTWSIDPVEWTGTGNTIEYTARRIENGIEVETTGLRSYSIANFAHITSILVTFSSGATHTFEVDWKQTSTNGFVLTDGNVVNITDPDKLMALNSYATTRLNNTTYTSAAISDVSLIKEIHITPTSTTSVDPYYGAYLCSAMSNLTIADINLPQSITTTSHYFCYNMFYQCTSLTTLPSTFNLPQSITTIGNSFCQHMFNACSITSLPAGFNIPQGITSSGTNFCYCMFRSCASLTTLPTGFNLPQGISTPGDYFCWGMFYGCTVLGGTGSTGTKNFKAGTSATGSYSDHYALYMFRDAAALLAAGCPITPTGAQLYAGYNIARS